MDKKPMKPLSEPTVPSDRRVLLCIPIVHTQADMGALNEPIQRLKVKKLGKKIWEHNLELVKNFWTQIEQVTEGESAGAILGHSTPRERRGAAEKK